MEILNDLDQWQARYPNGNRLMGYLWRFLQVILIPLLAVGVVVYSIFRLSPSVQLFVSVIKQTMRLPGWLLWVLFLVIVGILWAVAFNLTLLHPARRFFISLYRSPLEKGAMTLIISRLLGWMPYVIVNDAKIAESHSWVSWWGGPVIPIIYDGFALYLECGNRFSRVIGAGMPIPVIDRYETMKTIVDLRPQVWTGSTSVWTKDGIKLTLHLRMECQIMAGNGNPPTKGDLLYPYDPLSVRRATEYTALRYNHAKKIFMESDWLDGIAGKVKGCLGNYFSSHRLDELFREDRGGKQILSPEIIECIVTSLNQKSEAIGVHLSSLQITEVDLPPDVHTQQLQTWEAEKQGLVAIIHGDAEAHQIRTRERARAEAQRDLIIALANSLKNVDPAHFPEMLLISLSEILDQGLKDPLIQTLLAKETIEMLGQIRKMI